MDKGINERIREYRKKRKMTQEEVGEALGMKCSTYSQMERKGKITVEIARKIAEILEVDPDIIMFGEVQTPFPVGPVVPTPITFGTPGKDNPFTPPSEPEIVGGYKYGEITLSVLEERIINLFRDLSPKKQKEFKEFLNNLWKK